MSEAQELLPTEWIDRIRAAAADRTRLHIVGGGTKAFARPAPEGEALSTLGFRGIVSYEPTELVVTARAGTSLAELEAALAEQGQCLAFEPPHFGPGATVGGMVAAGLSGPARVAVGCVRDFVLGVRLVDGQGQWLTFGGQVMKNVAGYDVSRVLAGSWGQLGVIGEVSLKVLPEAPAEATLLFHLGQHDALEQLHRWCAQPLPLNASCWVKDTTAAGSPECLFVRLRGAKAAVESACERMVREANGQRLDAAQVAPDWAACREQTLPFFQAPSAAQALWRLSVPPTAPMLDLPASPLIEWHGGLRWVWAPLDAADALRAMAREAGGHATLFRAPAQGDGGVPREQPLAPANAAIAQRLRAAFDPAGIFSSASA